LLERFKKWQEQKKAKLEEEREREKDKDLEECTFKPDIVQFSQFYLTLSPNLQEDLIHQNQDQL